MTTSMYEHPFSSCISRGREHNTQLHDYPFSMTSIVLCQSMQTLCLASAAAETTKLHLRVHALLPALIAANHIAHLLWDLDTCRTPPRVNTKDICNRKHNKLGGLGDPFVPSVFVSLREGRSFSSSLRGRKGSDYFSLVWSHILNNKTWP